MKRLFIVVINSEVYPYTQQTMEHVIKISSYLLHDKEILLVDIC